MKTRLLTIALAAVFLTILGGAYFLTSIGETPLAASIKFDPNFIEWDTVYPPTWTVWIQSADDLWNPKNVDGSTVLFEHMVPAMSGYYATGRWYAIFDGQAIFNILSSKIGHMGIPPDISTKTPVHYYFTVSGNLMDGSAFEGEGWIAVRFVSGFPDPPPPPP